MDKTLSHQISKERNKLKSYLKDSGRQVSSAREIIFDAVVNFHGHFTAEDLHKAIQHKHKKVSRATVYRSLKELLESGVIRETAFGDKHHHFEHIYDEKPHHHAQCLRCHQFIEFPDLQEDIVYHPLLEKAGFKILGHEMHFYGICKKCKERKNV